MLPRGVDGRDRCAKLVVMRTPVPLTLGLLAASLAAQAKPPSAEDLAARRASKLASPVFAAAGFGTDLAAARKQAQDSGRPIFAYLTRSYAG